MSEIKDLVLNLTAIVAVILFVIVASVLVTNFGYDLSRRETFLIRALLLLGAGMVVASFILSWSLRWI